MVPYSDVSLQYPSRGKSNGNSTKVRIAIPGEMKGIPVLDQQDIPM